MDLTITKEQMVEYFDHINTVAIQPPKGRETVVAVMDDLLNNDEHPPVRSFFDKTVVQTLFRDPSPSTLAVSFFLTGFNMGREFEQRKSEIERLNQTLGVPE